MILSSLRSNILFGARALRRDWNSGELRLLVLALVVAVAAVSSVGFLADRVGRALERDAGQMLGGDLALRSDQAIQPELIEHAQATGLEVAQTLEFPSMVGHGEHNQLIALKAVSPNYPLRGALRVLDPATQESRPAGQAPPVGTVWVDPQVLNALDVPMGAVVHVGDADLKIGGVIAYEPDRGMRFVNVAPRVMMNIADLPATGLIAPGSRVAYRLLLAGGERAVNAYREWLDGKLARGQRLATLDSTRPAMQRALDRAGQFLVLVALLTVMLAAVAVALATRRFALRHQDGIAVMRCLGAGKAQLGQMLWTEFILLGVIAAAAGAALGYVVHQGLVLLVSGWLQTPLPPPSWRPVIQGLATGMLLLLGFAMPPLAALRQVPPARVLRRQAGSLVLQRWLAYASGAIAFFLLTLWISKGDLRLASIVAGGFLAALLVFVMMAYALLRLLSVFRFSVRGHPALRFALAGIARRRSLTVTQLCALSVGLMILLLLGITRADLLQGWQSTLPADAPNTFLINIQADQRAPLEQRLAARGFGKVVMSPMVRGRLLSINDKPVSADHYDEPRAKRLVDREFNLSYASELASSNDMVAGRWLDPDAQELTLEEGLAESLGIVVGDTVTFDVAGTPIQARVSGLREVDWDSFQANFFAILSPAALRDAPASFITSFHVPHDQRPILRELLQDFPNLTVFDVGSILAQVQHVLDQVVQAVQLLFLFTVLAGILVLGAALFSTRDERMHEVAVLRTLGASGRQLGAALRIELVLLGAMAGMLAASAAVAVAWLLAREVFDFPLTLSWWPWAAGMAGGCVAAMVGGHFALAGILRSPPLITLRETA